MLFWWGGSKKRLARIFLTPRTSCWFDAYSKGGSNKSSAAGGSNASTEESENGAKAQLQNSELVLVASDDPKEGETLNISKPSVQGFAKEAFILLNQERFVEHKAPVLLCEASPQGSVVATVDATNCLKIWAVSPSQTTRASLVLDATPTCLSWDQDGDCDVLFLGFEGRLSQLNIESLSLTHFEPKGDYTRVVTLATMSDMLACSFGNSDKSSKEGSLVLLNTQNFDTEVSTTSFCTVNPQLIVSI